MHSSFEKKKCIFTESTPTLLRRGRLHNLISLLSYLSALAAQILNMLLSRATHKSLRHSDTVIFCLIALGKMGKAFPWGPDGISVRVDA